MIAWGYNRDPWLLMLPQITITLPHISLAGKQRRFAGCDTGQQYVSQANRRLDMFLAGRPVVDSPP